MTITIDYHPLLPAHEFESSIATKLQEAGYSVVLQEGLATIHQPGIIGGTARQQAAARLKLKELVKKQLRWQKWDLGFCKLLYEAYHRMIPESRVRPIGIVEIWDYRTFLYEPRFWQMLLMFGAGGGCIEAVRLALDRGANPKTELFHTWTDVNDADTPVSELDIAFNWAGFWDLQNGQSPPISLRLPLEAAIAGRSSVCIEALLPDLPLEHIQPAVNWITGMKQDLWRCEAGVSLAEALTNPEVVKHFDSKRCAPALCPWLTQ